METVSAPAENQVECLKLEGNLKVTEENLFLIFFYFFFRTRCWKKPVAHGSLHHSFQNKVSFGMSENSIEFEGDQTVSAFWSFLP